jgi:hypothetical protein
MVSTGAAHCKRTATSGAAVISSAGCRSCSKEPDSIPGLTWPDVTFPDRLTLPLGGDRGDVAPQA